MANFKRKANYKTHKSCSLCKPHKSVGNSVEAIKHKYRTIKGTQIIYESD